jgi:CheY-like chemotaxis protein
MHKRRILVIDDSETIHLDFRRILCPAAEEESARLEDLEAALFGRSFASVRTAQPLFEMDSAYQGQEGVAMVRRAMAEGRPYDVVFLDYRMPPGWNGFETLRHLREVAPLVPIVFCSAYSDYSWEQIHEEFGRAESLVELKKPFKKQELYPLALTLTEPPRAAP